MRGGRVIESGGFGCIFDPPLKCKNGSTPATGRGVTKLMKRRNSVNEFNEVSKFYKLLQGIPNFRDYFLVDGFSLCEPQTLTANDLADFDEKCSALKKMHMSAANVNRPENLRQLLALNMPYGGLDAGNYIDQYLFVPGKMVTFNESLTRLLRHGILPMNKVGVYHCDLKSSNILAREEGHVLKTRLIDWGLSASYSGKHGGPIPRVLTNRPFQFNVPFSNVIFTVTFDKMYKEFQGEHKAYVTNFYHVRTFVINYVHAWVEQRGPGHLKTINKIFKYLFQDDIQYNDAISKDDIIEYEYTFYFIFDYLTKVIVKFTQNGHFDKMAYFQQVFLSNIDIWGFVSSYIPIVEDIVKSSSDAETSRVTPTEREAIRRVKELIMILVEAAEVSINVDTVISQLIGMNAVLAKITRPKKKLSQPEVSSSSSVRPTLKPARGYDKKRFHQKMVTTLKRIKLKVRGAT